MRSADRKTRQAFGRAGLCVGHSAELGEQISPWPPPARAAPSARFAICKPRKCFQ